MKSEKFIIILLLVGSSYAAEEKKAAPSKLKPRSDSALRTLGLFEPQHGSCSSYMISEKHDESLFTTICQMPTTNSSLPALVGIFHRSGGKPDRRRVYQLELTPRVDVKISIINKADCKELFQRLSKNYWEEWNETHLEPDLEKRDALSHIRMMLGNKQQRVNNDDLFIGYLKKLRGDANFQLFFDKYNREHAKN